MAQRIGAPGCFGNTGLRVRFPPKPEVADMLGSWPLHTTVCMGFKKGIPLACDGVRRTVHLMPALEIEKPNQTKPEKKTQNET